MKLLIKLSVVIVIICGIASLQLHAQVTYTWRYYTSPSGKAYDGYYLVGMPSDSASNVNKRPVLAFYPGAGETGASGNLTLANAAKYGPVRDVYQGLWSGGVVQSNGYADSTVYPIYLVMQNNNAASGSMAQDVTKAVWDVFYTSYSQYIDTNQLHMSGLSLGGRQGLLVLANSGRSAGLLPFAHQWASAFFASAGGRSANITNNADLIGSWAAKGGRLYYAIGAQDALLSNRYDTATVIKMLNDSLPGAGEAHVWHLSDGFSSEDHCCWDVLWGYNKDWYFLHDLNATEWQLQFTKTPQAVAQASITTNASSITLNGVTNGWNKTVAWTKISGTGGVITTPSKDTTSVTGLTAGSYVFRLTVTNTADGRTATHDVNVTIDAIPVSDGYLKAFPRIAKPKM